MSQTGSSGGGNLVGPLRVALWSPVWCRTVCERHVDDERDTRCDLTSSLWFTFWGWRVHWSMGFWELTTRTAPKGRRRRRRDTLWNSCFRYRRGRRARIRRTRYEGRTRLDGEENKEGGRGHGTSISSIIHGVERCRIHVPYRGSRIAQSTAHSAAHIVEHSRCDLAPR